MATLVRFDPFDYAVHEDPFPVYRQLRDDAPVYFDVDRGFYALSRHADVRAAVDDWETFSSAGGITLERAGGQGVEPMLIEMDPPRHTELRALVSRAFTPRRVAELEAPTRALARDLIARFDDRRVDVVAEFSAFLPMAVICRMLGIPMADQDELRLAADAMLHREPDSDQITPAGIEGATTLYSYFDAVIRRRRDELGDDLVSALVGAEVDGRALTHSEILGFCFLLIIAGNETTTKLIGNAVYWLARFPDQRAVVLADPSLVASTVEETLRFDGSTQALARTLTRDVDLHGTTMEAGRKLLLLFGSANRDERFWQRPDEYDISRNPAGHLAFGHGIHHCLGAALARLETRVALEELLPVLGDYDVDIDASERVHSANVRGFKHLPVDRA